MALKKVMKPNQLLITSVFAQRKLGFFSWVSHFYAILFKYEDH